MWVLPILLCLIACGLGISANLEPKLEISLEPKGRLGRMVDEAYRKMRFALVIMNNKPINEDQFY